ncbi:MAG TPA: SGNH hydrolase domain-containing protein [Candidatus Saccharimonadales bacterium]|nr:SGNH hydrolase domain-containing protein [Candidatus Saccharimonadales bacterium]
MIYADGCHLGFLETQPGSCVFGDAASRTVVVLFGDSIAGQWFPALAQLATARGWRLVSLTKSACTAADVTVWNSSLGRAYTECDLWRANALARITAEHPTLVVVSDDRLYELAIGGAPVPVAQRPEIWRAGLARTLVRLHAVASRVVLIGDTPRARADVLACLAMHLANSLACATRASAAIDAAWLAADRVTADAVGAGFIDPSPWICPSDPCPPVIGKLLVYREQDHLTAVFAASLAPRLGAALQIP